MVEVATGLFRSVVTISTKGKREMTEHFRSTTCSASIRGVRCAMVFTALLLLWGSLSASAKAQVVVDGFYHQVGSQFQYAFSVHNNTDTELAYVSAFTPDVPFTITGGTAPTGFTVDGSQVGDTGYVNFLQDLDDTTPQTFAPHSTVQFFRFTSDTFISNAVIDSLNVNGEPVGGQTITLGTAPEPATLSLMTIALVGLPVLRRRLR
jgi:hypothetical protein